MEIKWRTKLSWHHDNYGTMMTYDSQMLLDGALNGLL